MNLPELAPVLAALGSAATWALGSHLFRRALERGAGARPPSAAAANLYKNLLAAGVFAVGLALLDGAWPGAAAWPLLLVSGFLGFALGDTLYFAALPRCGVQVASMVALVHVPAAVLLAWIVRGETLAAGALLGGALVVLGVACVLAERTRGGRAQPQQPERPEPSEPSERTEPREQSKLAVRDERDEREVHDVHDVRDVREVREVRAGILFAAAGAVAQAAGVVSGTAAMQDQELLGGTLARLAGGVAGALALAALAGLRPRGAGVGREWRELARPWTDARARRGLFRAALFGSVLGLPLFHLALRGLESGVAAVLFATTPLFALPIGFALGERHGARAVLGAALGIAGVAIVVASA